MKQSLNDYEGIAFNPWRGDFSASASHVPRAVHIGHYPTLQEAVEGRREYLSRIAQTARREWWSQ